MGAPRMLEQFYSVNHPIWGRGWLYVKGAVRVPEGTSTVFVFQSNKYGCAKFTSQDVNRNNLPPFSVRVGQIKR